jgi:protocatechuate 3,4-dioxygenase beta subunit
MKERIFDLTRRRFLALGGALATSMQWKQAALASWMAPEAAVCRLSAEQEEGPYYVAGELFRANIAENKPGVPLSLRILVLDARSCKPLSNVAVDVWHCDALGVYSGFTEQHFGGPPGGPGGPPFDPDHPGGPPNGPPGPPPEFAGPPPENHPTDKLTFLRGIQLAGQDGTVTFRTVFPGFYMGRTNHIHFKVRLGGHASATSYEAGHTSHTGQIFFPEQIAAELMRREPYSLHAIHRTSQSEDGVFNDQHGELSIAKLQPLGPDGSLHGMHADIVAAVDPTATPAGVRRRGGPPGPPPEGD